MKIAITGGAGRIGKRSTEIALAQGHEVVSIDRVAPGQELIKLASEAGGRLSFVMPKLPTMRRYITLLKAVMLSFIWRRCWGQK